MIISSTIILLAVIALAVDPATTGAVPAFLALIFVLLLFLFSLLFNGTRRGFVIAASTTLFLILRLLGLGNILNLLLLVGVSATIEWYFSTNGK